MQYRTYRSYIKEKFGRPVLKIPVNAGFSCPNRDGTVSRKGCAFCDASAFSPVATDIGSPMEQFERAVKRAVGKYDRFIVYLQPYSNTYCSVSALDAVLSQFAGRPEVVGIAIGTRPDCLNDNMIMYLSEIAKTTYLVLELGLQSAEDRVLNQCNRGHNAEQFRNACVMLNAAKIQTVSHVMLGLPGESPNSAVITARMLADLPVHGVKIHQLMIIKGTAMEKLMADGAVKPLSIESYAEKLACFISYLRPDQYIHRIMADTGHGTGLIAPEWSLNKSGSTLFLNRYLESKGVFQGISYLKGEA